MNMNDVITVEDTQMQVREYSGQRVVTFGDIDLVHQRKPGTARNSFYKHKKHFVENEDYFVINKENSNVAKNHIRNVDIPNRGVTLFTEAGYLMLVKPFNDDLSWKVQRRLVNAYFKAKEDKSAMLSEQSRTLAPPATDWYDRNRRKMDTVCKEMNISHSTLYRNILSRLREKYDVDLCKEIYEVETGDPPERVLDILTYFPELGRMADDFLNKLEKTYQNID
ncbi:ORF6N domain-containing protein [Oscillospiraceae bacterium Marseille-Q3528]|nr:ORF6N domain-containing protein [Oscillospiraceae bacterium Marseille-Q3528]